MYTGSKANRLNHTWHPTWTSPPSRGIHACYVRRGIQEAGPCPNMSKSKSLCIARVLTVRGGGRVLAHPRGLRAPNVRWHRGRGRGRWRGVIRGMSPRRPSVFVPEERVVAIPRTGDRPKIRRGPRRARSLRCTWPRASCRGCRRRRGRAAWGPFLPSPWPGGRRTPRPAVSSGNLKHQIGSGLLDATVPCMGMREMHLERETVWTFQNTTWWAESFSSKQITNGTITTINS